MHNFFSSNDNKKTSYSLQRMAAQQLLLWRRLLRRRLLLLLVAAAAASSVVWTCACLARCHSIALNQTFFYNSLQLLSVAKPAGQGKESVDVLDVGLEATVLLGSLTHACMHSFLGCTKQTFSSKGVYLAKTFSSKNVHQVKASSKLRSSRAKLFLERGASSTKLCCFNWVQIKNTILSIKSSMKQVT